jgi:hypothetical protein
VAAAGGGRRRIAAGNLSEVCGLRISLSLFLLRHGERGFRRKKKQGLSHQQHENNDGVRRGKGGIQQVQSSGASSNSSK